MRYIEWENSLDKQCDIYKENIQYQYATDFRNKLITTYMNSWLLFTNIRICQIGYQSQTF